MSKVYNLNLKQVKFRFPKETGCPERTVYVYLTVCQVRISIRLATCVVLIRN